MRLIYSWMRHPNYIFPGNEPGKTLLLVYLGKAAVKIYYSIYKYITD